MSCVYVWREYDKIAFLELSRYGSAVCQDRGPPLGLCECCLEFPGGRKLGHKVLFVIFNYIRVVENHH